MTYQKVTGTIIIAEASVMGSIPLNIVPPSDGQLDLFSWFLFLSGFIPIVAVLYLDGERFR